MNIELGILQDGGVMMVSDKPLPDILCRVEYYRDQKLFNLVYSDEALGEDMTHYEIPDNLAQAVEAAPNIMIFTLFPDHEPIGYKVPLVQVGDMF